MNGPVDSIASTQGVLRRAAMTPSLLIRFGARQPDAVSSGAASGGAWRFFDAAADGPAVVQSASRVAWTASFAPTAGLVARSDAALLILAGDNIRMDGERVVSAQKIGAAFDQDAVSTLRRLRGAVCIFYVDTANHRAIVACDRAGTRAPSFTVRGEELIAGLSARDVASAVDSPPELRAQAIFDYLYCHVIPAPETIFDGVERLGPGEYLSFDSARARVDTYWTPSYKGSSIGMAEAKELFRKTLRQSVAEQLNAATTGAFLSGGTDSSTIAGVLAEVAGEPPKTYSIGFDVPGFDELGYARIAAKHFGTQHHEYYLTPDDLLASIPTVAASYDQPFGNSSVIPAYFCARLAGSDGVGKLLGGDGGDEIFGGNSRYARQKVLEAYQALPSWLARGVLQPSLDNAVAGSIPLLRKARSYVQQAVIPMPARMHTYNLVDRIGAVRIFSPSFLQAVDPALPAKQQRSFYARCTDADLVNRMLHFDWKYTLADNDLPKVVGACDLAGIAVGFPFLDDRMVAFANGLPPDWKVRRLKLRYFFKKSLADFLPRDIIVKKKHGFGMPFGNWLTVHAPLRSMVVGSLESLRDRGIVQRGFFDELLEKVVSEHAGFYGELVWIMTMLENWLAAHRPAYRFDTSRR